jgi:hypothetical protein
MNFSLIVYAGRRLPHHGISNKISNAEVASTLEPYPLTRFLYANRFPLRWKTLY